MGGHVFVSYAHADLSYVQELARHLKDAGLSVWFDHSIRAGDQWLETIEQRIEECSVFVVVMSEAAKRSKWVGREVALADDINKPVMPLLLSGDRPLFSLRTTHYHDVRAGGMPDNSFIADIRARLSWQSDIRLEAWAWWIEGPADGDDQSVGDLSTTGELLEIQPDVELFRVGKRPQPGRDGDLPWAAFDVTTASDFVYRVCWWDWTDSPDGQEGPYAGALYLRLASSWPISYESLARHARAAWKAYRAESVMIEPVLPDSSHANLPGDEALMSWAAGVAALTLSSPVRIVANEQPGWSSPEALARVFDAIAAMLPKDVAAALRFRTGTAMDDNGQFTVAVGTPPRHGAAVAVRPGAEPDLSASPEARAYREAIGRLTKLYSADAVVRHLRTDADTPHEFGRDLANAVIDAATSMDPLAAAGRNLAQGTEVDLGEVRALVEGAVLADHLSINEHEALLRFLLARGQADDLAVVFGNWLPQVADLFVEAFVDRARRNEFDDNWMDEAVELVYRADADRVLIALLDQTGGDALSAKLLARVTSYGIRADETRKWLLTPSYDTVLFAVMSIEGELLLPWLATEPRPPSWLDALTSLSGEVANPADRATADFVLLIAGRSLPPGLSAGSSYAPDRGYALRLADLALGNPRVAEQFNFALSRSLVEPKATDDALLLLDHMRQNSRMPVDVVMRAAVQVIRERPDLIDHPGAEKLVEVAAAEDEKIRTAVAVRAVARAARADAPASELARLLDRALRAQVGKPELRAALAPWPVAEAPEQTYELTVRLGRRLAGGSPIQQARVGFEVVAPLLDAAVLAPLARYIAEWAKQEDARHREALAQLRKAVRRR